MLINSILKREEQNKETLGSKHLKTYLMDIALAMSEKEQNLLTRTTILSVISNTTDRLKLSDIKSDKILDLAIKMGFIIEVERKNDYQGYEFVNKDYKNFFESEAILNM